MPRKVVNPFKERKVPAWMRYGIPGLVGGFLVCWYIFVSPAEIAVEDSAVLSPDPNLHLRQQQHPRGLLNDDDNANDAGIERDDDNGRGAGEPDGSGSRSSDEDRDKDWDDHQEQKDGASGDDYEQGEEEMFPDIDDEEFLDWIRSYYNGLEFEDDSTDPSVWGKKLTEPLLSESLALGCDYMVHNQKDAGNFNYQYDFVTHELDDDDSPVRQAGALWGISLCLKASILDENDRAPAYQTSIEDGIAFFREHVEDGPIEESRMVVYPGFEDESQSGVNALYGLALIEYLSVAREHPAWAERMRIDPRALEAELDGILGFLKYLQRGDGHFAQAYDREEGEPSEEYSPYYDGETMLCLVKAARYLGGDYAEDLVPVIERTAPILAKAYTVDAWRQDEHDSDLTKGFYQWSSMVFAEYYLAEWENYEYFGDCLLVLAHWIVHTHGILKRHRNTGYAFEGILSAYRVAEMRGHEEALSELSRTIDEGLYELTSWQVGGPLAHTNDFLVTNPTDERTAIGGIMNAVDQAPLRIDTAQHQMHAVMMALGILF